MKSRQKGPAENSRKSREKNTRSPFQGDFIRRTFKNKELNRCETIFVKDHSKKALQHVLRITGLKALSGYFKKTETAASQYSL